MKRIITLVALSFLAMTNFGQAPQRLSYQTVIRNATGSLVTNHAVGMKISILQGSSTGTAVYVETHTPTTNANGLATIEIGGGGLISGSFATINWSGNTYYLKTETDPSGGTSYTIAGTSQLLSVPYALNSKISDGVADNSITSTKIVDGTITGADIGNNAVTSGKIADNSIVTTDLTDNIITPVKISNLAVTTDKLANTSVTMDKIANLAVTTDKLAAGSVTTEKINAGAVTGPKIAQAGAVNGQVLKWNNTTWAPAIDETGSGGLALPYSGTISTGDYAFSISNSGSAIKGVTTGSSIYTSGVYGGANGDLGYGVYGAGPVGIYGTGFVGATGSSDASGGYGLRGEYTSSTNTGIGVYGISASPEGYSGYFSGGKFHIKGRTGIGITSPGAGLHISGTSFPESFLYLQSNTDEDAGIRFYEGTTAKWSLFCDGGTDGLQIYNYGGVTAIFCKQVSPCYVGIGTSQPTCQLQVGTLGDGSQARANAWNLLSDIRLKKDFSDLSDPLGMISKLKGFYFYWNTGTDQTRQVGFSAQDVRNVLPEVVSSASDGYLAIEYGKMAPLFVEAIKALKTENDRLKLENEEILLRLERLEAKVGK